MKTTIIGLGYIGTIHGWALSEAGCDITHVVRPGSKSRYTGGVPMDILDIRGKEEKQYTATYNPHIIEQITPEDLFELVIVASNHYQTHDIVREYRNQAPDAHSSSLPETGKEPRRSMHSYPKTDISGDFLSPAGHVIKMVCGMQTSRRRFG